MVRNPTNDLHFALLTCADEPSSVPRKFLIPVDETLKTLLDREDTDQNYQITIDDHGPKVRTTGADIGQ